jgi:hypothetical protein
MFLKKLQHSYIWERILIERLSEPIHLNLLSIFVAILGSYKAKISFDLILRQHNAYGILRAAEEAKKLGLKSVSIVEFGVAAGAGLLNMCKIAEKVSIATDVEFKIYGFDTGCGMPPPQDYRDHPELYQEGDFPMNQDGLTNLLPENAKLIIGELSDTMPAFLQNLSSESPVGYVVIDVDYYSSTKESLSLLTSDPNKYLPITFIYLDDVYSDYHNDWAGELLAVKEFNDENELRKIAPYKFLRTLRIFKNASWLERMYILHIFDHPLRQGETPLRDTAIIANPYMDK